MRTGPWYHRRGLPEGQYGRAGALERPLTGDGQRNAPGDRRQPEPAPWPVHELRPGQAEMQELGLCVGGERCGFVVIEEHRGELPQRFVLNAAGAGTGHVKTTSGAAQRRPGAQPEQPGLRAPLGEDAE